MTMTILLILGCTAGLLSVIAIVMGFMNFDEWEAGIEFLNSKLNSFELGVSNRNYELRDEGTEQELRIGLLLITVLFIFRKFDA